MSTEAFGNLSTSITASSVDCSSDDIALRFIRCGKKHGTARHGSSGQKKRHKGLCVASRCASAPPCIRNRKRHKAACHHQDCRNAVTQITDVLLGCHLTCACLPRAFCANDTTLTSHTTLPLSLNPNLRSLWRGPYLRAGERPKDVHSDTY
jgi:hypothetical protein